MADARAVIFDLGGTLVHWPEWDDSSPRRWRNAVAFAQGRVGRTGLPAPDLLVACLREAELAHWARVDSERWSGPPTALIGEGLRRAGSVPTEPAVLALLDGYAAAVDGWAEVDPDAASTLAGLRARGFRIGLLSNTWWAAEWHNADLAAHGLAPLLDALVYTSDLPHSKPHPSVFLEAASRLGVAADECIFVGDRPLDDVGGALSVGMRGVWRRGGAITQMPPALQPSAIIDSLAEILPLAEAWAARPTSPG